MSAGESAPAPRVRFAPSPTGHLHLGNARIALANWLFARAHGGAFILRFDDTDSERSRPEFADAIERDLTWLGLAWDEKTSQSARMDSYRTAFDKLTQSGRLYPCYETPEELERKRKAQLRAHKPPVYDRAALSLSDAERRRLIAEGRRAHWRFRLTDNPVVWDDLVRGPQRIEAGHVSDPVLVRADGTFLYMLPSAVDDAAMGITHVIRGEDHVANAALQTEILAALEFPPPRFGHLPLLADAQGGKLSKRLGALGLDQMRGQGIEPMAINCLLAALGTNVAPEPAADLSTLIAGFDLARFGRASPRFDLEELKALNARVLHVTPFGQVAGRLRALGCDRADERFWHAVRPNLATLADAKEWHDVCFGALVPAIEDAGLLAGALAVLPPEPWDDATWNAWTQAVARASGKKGRALFHPLRLALTARERGPEMKALLPLIGPDRARKRLAGESG